MSVSYIPGWAKNPTIPIQVWCQLGSNARDNFTLIYLPRKLDRNPRWRRLGLGNLRRGGEGRETLGNLRWRRLGLGNLRRGGRGEKLEEIQDVRIKC